MKLYVTRHGETLWNAEDKVCGLTDLSLTENGEAQARKLGQQLVDIFPDRIYVSPLTRAQQTCQIALQVRNQLLTKQPSSSPEDASNHYSEASLDIPIITEPRIIEQCYGIYEGKSRFDEGFLNNKKMFAYHYPGGESQIQTACRIYAFIDELKEKYPDDTILLVCHGGICRIIHTYFEDVTNDEFFEYGMGNCELKCYEC